MSKAGKQLIESAQQALDFARGTVNIDEYRIHLPAEIDVKKTHLQHPEIGSKTLIIRDSAHNFDED